MLANCRFVHERLPPRVSGTREDHPSLKIKIAPFRLCILSHWVFTKSIPLISTCHRWGNWGTQRWSNVPKVSARVALHTQTEHLPRDRLKTRSWEKDPDVEGTAEAKGEGSEDGRGKLLRAHASTQHSELLLSWEMSGSWSSSSWVVFLSGFSCPHFPMSLDDKCSVAWHRVTSSSVSKCLTHRCVRGGIWSCLQLAGPINHHQARESQWAH